MSLTQKKQARGKALLTKCLKRILFPGKLGQCGQIAGWMLFFFWNIVFIKIRNWYNNKTSAKHDILCIILAAIFCSILSFVTKTRVFTIWIKAFWRIFSKYPFRSTTYWHIIKVYLILQLVKRIKFRKPTVSIKHLKQRRN